jgi:pimeloyl-ACP methyl ester carboxylesterase
MCSTALHSRLADDVLQVLNSLDMVAPVVVGHSMSGEELTTLGDEHSNRLAGLVYLVPDGVRLDILMRGATRRWTSPNMYRCARKCPLQCYTHPNLLRQT